MKLKIIIKINFMKTSFDQTTGARTWLVEKWYQKTLYVVGTISAIVYLIGILAAIADELN